MDPLERIAAALERLSPPPPPPADLLAHPAYVWRGGQLTPARHFAPLALSALKAIDAQRDVLVANFERLAAGYPAQDTLLWGARGTGKSALVKSAAASAGIGLIEAAGNELATLPVLFDRLAGVERRFAIFVDDLGFKSVDDARALRSLLEGGAEARPANARLVVTSNRRHLIPRDMSENDPINPRDAADDALALADRFGLSIGFHVVDQDAYLEIVRGYAQAHGLPFDAQEAVTWATKRGSRSGRVAWQYVIDLAGRAGVSLDSD